MKKWLGALVLMIFLTGCQAPQTVIDWVDFVKWDGKQYESIYQGVIADEEKIGEEIGEVKFTVADNIKRTSYKIKDGDAGFLEKGTKLLSVIDEPDLIAVKSANAINGYKIYAPLDVGNARWQFDNIPLEKVEKIEIYQLYTETGNQFIKELSESTDVTQLLNILETSTEDVSVEPNMPGSDPLYYEIICYTDESIAYSYSIQFDGETYYWYPWETAILSDEIKHFIAQSIE